MSALEPLKEPFAFTFSALQSFYKKALDVGYTFMTCEAYARTDNKSSLNKVIVHRVDVDDSMPKAGRLLEMFNRVGVPATFFIRQHTTYNPFSFQNFRVLKAMRDSGHEIGHHSEVIDQARIWNEDPEKCLRRDLTLLNEALDINVVGSASHGGMTGLNNLDFWKTRKPSDFGLLYEGYDKEPTFNLFDTSFYISDSCWTYWKCYDKGVLQEGNCKTFGEHLDDGHRLIYLLVHPDTYYDDHIYE